MIKRLGYYAKEASEHQWPVFGAKHPDYVLVILPADENEVSPFHTTDHGEAHPTVRPPNSRSRFANRPAREAVARRGSNYAAARPRR